MSTVHAQMSGEVLVLEIDNPPVNATSQAVRRDLLAAIMRADEDMSVRAIVIAGAGRTFTAGGDITEFGKTPLLPHLPDVLNRIEACGKPVVTAWHGTALGGGCEIGLASHVRIMAPDAMIGLPEVKLGLMPGAGGTQRLPRLTGPAAALEIIASGRMVNAPEAKRLGIADVIADKDLRNEAIALARSLIGKKIDRVSARAVRHEAPDALAAAQSKVRKDARRLLAPLKAIELVDMAIHTPFAEGQPKERAVFYELMASPQSKALRHLFLAERAAAKLPELDGITARTIQRVGVIGAGTMGAGIAVAFLDAGLDVVLVEQAQANLDAGIARVRRLYERALKSGRMTDADMERRLSRLAPSADLGAISGCDLIIEAVFEDMDVKRALFARIGAIVPQDTILATNTSYLDINAMAESVLQPERFVGLHFFSPAHVMKLLEIVRGERTNSATLAAAVAIGRRLKKISVISGVCDGFIGNRILSRYRAQCEFMLEEGALPSDIDGALEAFGLAMGPFAVQDLSGLDVAWARRKRLAAARQPDERFVPIADMLCEQGRFGQKAGRGWYRYDDGKRVNDPEVERMIRDHAARAGRPQTVFTPEMIQMRVVAAMVNEGAKILEEKIAARASDIDLVLVNGYGFPNWRGGPMHFADEFGLQKLLAVAEDTAARDGRGFEVSKLFRQLTEAGGRFDTLPAASTET